MVKHIKPDCRCEGKICSRCEELLCRDAFHHFSRSGDERTPDCARCRNVRKGELKDATRQRRPLKAKTDEDIKKRILAKTEIQDNGCWEWTGQIRRRYGRITFAQGKVATVHRVMYEICKGSIPEDYQIDHLCRNTLCVNPDHLEAITRQENRRRADVHRRREKQHRHKSLVTWKSLYRDLYTQVFGEGGWENDADIRRQTLKQR